MPYRFRQWSILLLVSIIVYLLAFFLIFPYVGAIAIVISIAPTGIAAWYTGVRGGLIAALIATMFNIMLVTWAGDSAWESMFERGGISIVMFFVVSALIGMWGNVVQTMRSQSLTLAAERDALATEIAERVKAEVLLKSALEERDTLLKEVHHRVKNNLQIISSILNLQSVYNQNEETTALLQDSQNRIRTMALVHERLYQAESLSKISLGAYIDDLLGQLKGTYSAGSTSIETTLDDAAWVDIEVAIPCGLIINELVTNAIKYAYPNGTGGTIKVLLQNTAKTITLTVCDDGIGFSEQEVMQSESLGLQLVNSLVKQLQGDLTFTSDGGACFQIAFSNVSAG